MWKTMLIMFITCCKEKLSKNLCECPEQMDEGENLRALYKILQKEGAFLQNFGEMSRKKMLRKAAGNCGVYAKPAEYTARKTAEYEELSLPSGGSWREAVPEKF